MIDIWSNYSSQMDLTTKDPTLTIDAMASKENVSTRTEICMMESGKLTEELANTPKCFLLMENSTRVSLLKIGLMAMFLLRIVITIIFKLNKEYLMEERTLVAS